MRGATGAGRTSLAVGCSRSAAMCVSRRRVTVPLLLALVAAACGTAAPTGTAYVGATVIDGRGGAPRRDMVVVTRGTRIEAVVPAEGFSLPDATTEVDAKGLVIVPGFIDSHVHAPRWALTRFLAWGVTSVRDVHGTFDSVLALRAELRSGATQGPRLFSAGAMLDAPPTTYPDALPVTDEAAGRKAVDRLAIENADLIKLYARIDPALFAAIADEARTLKMPMTAHLGLVDAVSAAKLGVRSIEHLSGVPEATLADPSALYAAHREGFFAGWTAFERAWAGLDSAALARTAQQLAAENVTLVPTLTLHDLFSRADTPAAVALSELADMPAAELTAWNVPGMIRRAGWTAADFAAFRAARSRQDQFLRDFVGAGGVVAAGTDATNQLLVPGAALHREMALLVRVGLTPIEAIRSATSVGARLAGHDSLGVVAAGKVADLVILEADPTVEIANTRRIRWVVQAGRTFSPDSLRAAWRR